MWRPRHPARQPAARPDVATPRSASRTPAKTLAQARETVVWQVEARVQKSLSVPKNDLRSILRLVGGQLDVSISRVLGTP